MTPFASPARRSRSRSTASVVHDTRRRPGGRSLLRLAGVDPAQYDLAKIKHNGEPKVYRDEKVIDLKDGDAFVTVRQSAQVA